MCRMLLVACLILAVGSLQTVSVTCSPWSEYRGQVDSIFQDIDSLNMKVRTIHINYSQKQTSPEEAAANMRLMAVKFREIRSRAENLKPPPQWERYHETFLEVTRLTVESTEELRLYFESGDKAHENRSLALIHLAVGELQKLVTLAPTDEDPPRILTVQREPPNPVAQEPVEITVSVVDLQTGLGRVSLNYTVNDGDWVVKDMRLVEGSDWDGLWTATIPGQASGSRTTYEVVAIDKGGNTARSGLDTYALMDLTAFIPIIVAVLIVAVFGLVRLRTRRVKRGLQPDLTTTQTNAASHESGQSCDEGGHTTYQD